MNRHKFVTLSDPKRMFDTPKVGDRVRYIPSMVPERYHNLQGILTGLASKEEGVQFVWVQWYSEYFHAPSEVKLPFLMKA